MLTLGLVSYILAIPLFSDRISSTVFSRITAIILFFSGVLAWNSLYYYPLSYGGVSLYSGLFHVSVVTQGFEVLLLLAGGLILFEWGPVPSLGSKSSDQVLNTRGKSSSQHVSFSLGGTSTIERSVEVNSNFVHVSTINEHSLLVLFSVVGSCILISSYNLLSMYIGIEMQSFAVYILSTLYRNSQSSTSAGLKYFLLGSLASSIIVLGTAVIYAGTGITGFEDLATLISVNNMDNTFVTVTVAGGLLLIGIGYIFKVGAAPLYNWSPDVYDGVPTVITTWISTMPKIGILVYLLNITCVATGYSVVDMGSVSESLGSLYTVYAEPLQTLLLVSSVLSFLVGSIVGLSQYRIKRLLTFSTINHLGFMLLALAVSTEESVEGFVFYLVQYTLTNVNTFLVLLAFGYMSKGVIMGMKGTKVSVREFVFLDDLKGQFFQNPLLAISFAVSLFSMAGVPPLVGFFAKQMVLYSVSYSYSYIAIIGIITSVIGASYYLKIVQLMFFGKENVQTGDTKLKSDTSDQAIVEGYSPVTTMHSSVIAIVTLGMTLYLLDPSILLNACHLLSLSVFTT